MEYVFEYICSVFKIENVQPFQVKCLDNVHDCNSVCLSYPTGSGKSLCYEVYPLYYNAFPSSGSAGIVVIVIEPLIAIMEEKVQRLTSLGFTAVHVSDNTDLQDVIDCKYTFLFASPERLLGEGKWRDVLSCDALKCRRVLLVIDEAHTVLEWFVYISFDAYVVLVNRIFSW